MATVVLTPSICKSITDNMLKPLQAENKELEAKFGFLAKDSGNKLLEMIRGAIPADMLKLLQQTGWVIRDTLTVNWFISRDGTDISNSQPGLDSRVIRIEYSDMPIPGHCRNYYGTTGNLNVYLNQGEQNFPELYEVMKAIVDNETSQQQLKDRLTKLFEDSRTLNRLEKIWPSVTEFVTPDTAERLRRKVERTKAEPISTLDDSLQTAIITSRIQKVP